MNFSMNCKGGKKIFKPLESAALFVEGEGTVIVMDGLGREYVNTVAAPEVSFTVGGALGNHVALLKDSNGSIRSRLSFKVDCETEINDDGGNFKELLDILHYTMIRGREASSIYCDGKIYKFFVSWLRDHVHTLKGMKYFYPDIKSAIELYRDYQREDGMIWDNVETKRDFKPTDWNRRFGSRDFIGLSKDKRIEFKRIPVENDVEYLFIEGIYYTWKVTGDDEWMKGMLDSAIKAYDYTMNSPYRWSKKYNLLKRGFTIDTWDFQFGEDAAITGDIMVIDKDKTRFGVMHGDNTGFSIGCFYLAEMLDVAGRSEEAEKYRKLGKEIKERLDALSWNGSFYIHHVPEDPTVKREFGVDQSKQISLSNAYALNRNLTHEQCVSIIKEYLKIRENLPYGSPGEWYTIYPPFERGFEGHSDKWEYMNAGVISIVAGELAHGAFEHGFEEYGVDILQRIHRLAKAHNNYLDCCFRGAQVQPPAAKFTPVDISGSVNAAEGIPGWNGSAPEEFNELPSGLQTFENIPFLIPVRSENDGKSCISLISTEEKVAEAYVPVNNKAKSIYFLHSINAHSLAGTITLEYADGKTHTQYINANSEILHWWVPYEPRANRGSTRKLVIAWEGKSVICKRVGVSLYGMTNPHPDKELSGIRFTAAKGGKQWSIFAFTLSDSDVYLRPSDVSFGIPDNWGAAAVVYGLIEGLAGVVDKGTSFDKVRLSPRWSVSDVRKSDVTVKYPASDGYVAYKYALNEADGCLELEVTGNSEAIEYHLLLPKAASKVESVKADGVDVSFETNAVEGSLYADFKHPLKGISKISVRYA